MRDAARSAGFRWWLVLSVAMCLWISYFYWHVLTAPNSVLFAGNGDGLKNYFTYAWHVDHDKGLLHFGGSGYPFGDHVFFTDGHPLLGWVLQAMPFLAPWKIGILNVSVLVSIVVCSWCLFGLLREFGVVPWAAALAALGLAALEPQVHRMTGHLSLAHCWMFPLAWYALVRTRRSERWLLWSCVTGLVVLVAFLIHPYAGFMSVLFIASYYLCSLGLRWRASFRSARTYVEPSIMAVVPLVLFLLIMNAGDVFVERPGQQIGMARYATQVASLVMPVAPPLDAPVSTMLPLKDPDWESLCYLGLSSLLVLLAVAIAELGKLVGRKRKMFAMDELGVHLIAAFLVLLFAMQVWQDLVGDRLPILSQFRASGRFAWPFYFVCGVFAVVRAHRYLLVQTSVRRPLAVLGFVALLGFYAVEGWGQHAVISSMIGHERNPFLKSNNDGLFNEMLNSVSVSAPVAIIPLPYVQNGSDHYQRSAPDPLVALAYAVSEQAGVPLMSGNIIRTSHRNTRDLLAILTPSYFPKHMATRFSLGEHFVLLRDQGDVDPEEEQLWNRGTPLFQNERGALRTITAKDLFACDRDQRLADFTAMRPSLPASGECLISSARGPAPPELVRQVFTSSDSMSNVVRSFQELRVLAPGELDTSLTYEVSFLFRAVDLDAVNISLILEHAEADGSDMHWEPLRDIRALPMQLADGWTVATMMFKPHSSTRSYKFLLHGPDDMHQRYSVHHLLVRPVVVDAWREGEWRGKSVVFLNNVPLANTDDRDAAH
ncbi:MAG TPA: hypothetical protein PK760_01420 [Flavobacteriales bacterium]|nr:hypothetical protein [Flavobacteriales bacterium]